MSPLTFYTIHTEFSPFPSWLLSEYEYSCSVWGTRQMKTWAESCFEQNYVERINRPSCQGCLIEVETSFFPIVGWLHTGTTFAEYNQQDVTFQNLFISIRRSTCFRRFFRPSWGDQNCTFSVRCLSHQYWCLTLYVQFWAPHDGRKTRLKHVERLTEIKWKKSHLVGCTLRIYYRSTDLMNVKGATFFSSWKWVGHVAGHLRR